MNGYQNPEELRAIYQEKQSMQKVADHYGVSKKTIINYMNKFNIDRKPMRKPLDIELMKKMVEEGKLVKDIAKEFGVCTILVRKRMAEQGIKADTFHKGYTRKESGYLLVRNPNHPRANNHGYVPQHTLIYEQYLGRYLNNDELIHHINGNKSDNRIENLVLMNAFDHKSKHSQQDRKQVDLHEVRRLLDEGNFLKDVCALYGLSESGLRKKLHRYGLYKRLTKRANQYTSKRRTTE